MAPHHTPHRAHRPPPGTKAAPAAPSSLWITGINPAREALRAGRFTIREMVLARADVRIQEMRQWAAQQGIPWRQADREALTALVGHEHHQGVALRLEGYPYTPLEDFLRGPLEARDPLLILDSIQDPQNLGALLRSACFLGAKGVIIPRDRAAGVTETVIKVAAGATSFLPVVQVTNLARSLEDLKEAGLWIVGLDVEGDRSLYEADLSGPLGLVVGNEQKGMRPLVRQSCDFLVKIPTVGPLDSLNAAAAGAIAMAEVQRQRLMRGKGK